MCNPSPVRGLTPRPGFDDHGHPCILDCTGDVIGYPEGAKPVEDTVQAEIDCILMDADRKLTQRQPSSNEQR